MAWQLTDDEELNKRLSGTLTGLLEPPAENPMAGYDPSKDRDPWENPVLAAAGQSTVAPPGEMPQPVIPPPAPPSSGTIIDFQPGVRLPDAPPLRFQQQNAEMAGRLAESPGGQPAFFTPAPAPTGPSGIEKALAWGVRQLDAPAIPVPFSRDITLNDLLGLGDPVANTVLGPKFAERDDWQAQGVRNLMNPLNLAGLGALGGIGRGALTEGQAVAATLGGSFGAPIGGEAAEAVGAPKVAGELIGGLAGGIGGIAAPRALQALDMPTNVPRLLTEEAGSLRVPGAKLTPDDVRDIPFFNDRLQNSPVRQRGFVASAPGAVNRYIEDLRTMATAIGMNPEKINSAGNLVARGRYQEAEELADSVLSQIHRSLATQSGQPHVPGSTLENVIIPPGRSADPNNLPQWFNDPANARNAFEPPRPGAAVPSIPPSAAAQATPPAQPVAPIAKAKGESVDADRMAAHMKTQGFTDDEIKAYFDQFRIKTGEQVGREQALTGEQIRLQNRAANMTAATEGTTRQEVLPEVRARQREITDKAIQGGAQRLGEAGAPPVAQQAFLDFASRRAAVLEKLPDNPTMLRRAAQKITGDVPSPFLAEMVNSERELADVVRAVPGAGSTAEQIEEAAQKAQQVFRDMMLDRKYGTDNVAKTAAKQVLQNNDAERMAMEMLAKSTHVTQINNILRQALLGFDVAGAAGQQGLRALRASPALASGGVYRLLDALGAAPELYRANDVPRKVQQMADGVIRTGTEAADITRGGRNVVTKGFEYLTGAQFEALDKARGLMYDGLLLQNWAANKLTRGALGGNIGDATVRRHIAEFVNTMGSTARTTSGAKRGVAEKLVGLSPKMARAQVNELLTPARLGTGEQRLNALNYVIGTGISLAVANELNKEFGVGDFVMNPLDKDFTGRITTKLKDSQGRNLVLDLLPQAALQRTILNSIEKALAKDPEGALQDWERYGAGRLGPGVSGALRIVGGRGYDREGQYYYGDMPADERLKASIPLPLGARKPIEQAVRGDKVDLQAALLGQTGAGLYPESASSLGNRMVREAVANGTLPATYRDAQGNEKPVESLADLKAADPLAHDQFVRQRPELKEGLTEGSNETTQRIRKLQDDGYAQQLERDQSLLTANPRQWRELSADERAKTAAAIRERAQDYDGDPKEKTALQKALRIQGEAIEANTTAKGINWEGVDRAIAQLSQSDQDLLFQSKLAGDTPTVQQYYRDLRALEPYFDQRDKAWAQLKTQSPLFKDFDTLDDFRDDRIKLVMEKNNLSRTVAEKLVNDSIATISPYLQSANIQYLTQHRELIPLLDKYGFDVPSALIGLTNPAVGVH